MLNGFAPADLDARDRELTIEALSGGLVDLPVLATLRDPATGTHSGSQINLKADGAGAVVNAPQLVSLLDRDLATWFTTGTSQLIASNGGTLTVPRSPRSAASPSRATAPAPSV